MSVRPVARRRALAAVEAWLLEPPSPAPPRAAPARVPRPVVAVVGLAPRCGTTTLARALGVELARRDDNGAATVAGSAKAPALGFGRAAGGRLARLLEPAAGGRVQAVGRLCLTGSDDHVGLADVARQLAPLVFDLGHGAVASGPVSLADHVLLVADPSVEPALAAVVAASLARIGPEPLVVLNRAAAEGAWRHRPALRLPSSRLGARLAAAGRSPGRLLGGGLGELSERCGAPA